MFKITPSDENKDSVNGRDKAYYLDLYQDDGFRSKLPGPDFYPSPERDDIFILDFAKGPSGLKSYGAEKLIATTQGDNLAYASPRVGHASEAIALLAQLYGKRAVFFAAASKEITPHQAVVMAYGCELRFVKMSAMSALNAWIRQWAEKFNGIALPFGLANTPMVTAGLVNMCDEHSMIHGEPPEFHCAVSTGTMIRALQIGWPNAIAKGTAVARSIQDGEKGKADVVPYHLRFYKHSEFKPEFDTTGSYDAKAYKRFIDEGIPGAVFINVGSDEQIESRLVDIPGWQKIDAQREWGDQSAFEKP